MRNTPTLAHLFQVLARGALVGVLVAGLATGTTLAGKPSSGGGGHGGGCTAKAPLVNVDNTWAWGQGGSFGLPGQKLTYAINVINYDVGCAASSFAISVAVPNGFSLSIPTNSISLKSSTSGYVFASVTSPSVVADGDYQLVVTAHRSGTTNNIASTTTYYKVYSTDVVAPTLFWASPGDGAVIASGAYSFSVSSTDDHAIKSIDLYVDGAYRSTTLCEDISSTCQLYYSGSIASGQHTATFTSHDWLGNVGTVTTSFSAN